VQRIYAVDDEELAEGEEPLFIVLERQISYFADEGGLNGLLEHLGDSPWWEVLKVPPDGFNDTNPCKPFSLWKNVDADLKNLIGGLTNFDPAKWLTAHEALSHRWLGTFEYLKVGSWVLLRVDLVRLWIAGMDTSARFGFALEGEKRCFKPELE